LLFGGEELQRMREVVKSPEFDNVWKADLHHAGGMPTQPPDGH